MALGLILTPQSISIKLCCFQHSRAIHVRNWVGDLQNCPLTMQKTESHSYQFSLIQLLPSSILHSTRHDVSSLLQTQHHWFYSSSIPHNSVLSRSRWFPDQFLTLSLTLRFHQCLTPLFTFVYLLIHPGPTLFLTLSGANIYRS